MFLMISEGLCAGGHCTGQAKPMSWEGRPTQIPPEATLTWQTFYFWVKQKRTSRVGKNPWITWQTRVSNKYACTFKYAGGHYVPPETLCSGICSCPWGAVAS